MFVDVEVCAQVALSQKATTGTGIVRFSTAELVGGL